MNYNRTEPAEKRSPGAGIKDERPIAVESVGVDFALPAGTKAISVKLITPEDPDAVEVKFAQKDGRVQFTVPQFLVYSVARIALAKS